jgi:hypothetical protein
LIEIALSIDELGVRTVPTLNSEKALYPVAFLLAKNHFSLKKIIPSSYFKPFLMDANISTETGKCES